MKKLIVFVLAFFGMFSLCGCETNYEIERALMEKGPWSSEAIWVDNNSQIYLICTNDNDSQYADVEAYLYIDGQWCSTQLELYQGAPIVCFVASDGERVLEARARMHAQNLQLYSFNVYNKNFALQYTDIEISKFSYHEQIEKLPFEIMQ